MPKYDFNSYKQNSKGYNHDNENQIIIASDFQGTMKYPVIHGTVCPLVDNAYNCRTYGTFRSPRIGS